MAERKSGVLFMAYCLDLKGIHRNWSLNQQFLSESRVDVDAGTQKKLEQLILHSYSKVSPANYFECEKLGLQVTPLLSGYSGYHRLTGVELLSKVDEDYARDAGLKPNEMHVISSPLLSEVIERELPYLDLNLNVSTIEELEILLENLLKGPLDSPVLINFSKFITDPSEFKEVVTSIEDLIIQKIHTHFGDSLLENAEWLTNKFFRNLHLMGFVNYKNEHILVTPEFLTKQRFDAEINSIMAPSWIKNRGNQLYSILDDVIARNGYRVSPAQAKGAWLKVKKLEEIFSKLNMRITESTQDDKSPVVCHSFDDFLSQPIVSKFHALSQDPSAPPYLRVVPKGTFLLLSGLANCGVDKAFSDKGIAKLLQIAYFRMLNAMNGAVHAKHDLLKFVNEIEVIHQEIQTLLTLVEPHDSSVFSTSMIRRLSPIANAYLKASGMHCFSSVCAGVEKQKGSRELRVAVLSDSYYYASSDNLKLAKTYDVIPVMEGQPFTASGKVDLFIAEFHHNIAVDKKVYMPVNVLDKIKGLYAQGVMADQFTVLIDTTIDLEKSEEMKALLSDPLISKLINEGKLNIAIIRSAQKFDMLGMDNYYGGIAMTINKKEAFSEFNARMDAVEDQLTGVDYQGLSHIQKYGEGSIDAYRKEIMDNTQRMYKKIPEKFLYSEGSSNPMQISRIEDDKMFFLDVKFPNYPISRGSFINALIRFVDHKKLFFTSRVSFGFMNANLTAMDEDLLRFSAGLESEAVLDAYAAFFQAVQKEIDQTEQIQEYRDDHLADRLDAMDVTSII